VADKSPRQTNTKKSGKSLKEKRADKKASAAGKENFSMPPAKSK